MKVPRLAILIIIVSISSLTGATSYTRELELSAYWKEYHTVSVYPLYSDSSISSTEGFPFDLLGDDVLENQAVGLEGGRIIGHWSLNSNHPEVKITIAPEDLLYTGDNIYVGTTVPSLPYVLSFYYEFPVFNDESATSYVIKSGAINVGSRGLDLSKTQLDSSIRENIVFVECGDSAILSTDNGYLPYGINTSLGYIRFILPNGYSEDLKNDQLYPVGTYSATVEITIEGK